MSQREKIALVSVAVTETGAILFVSTVILPLAVSGFPAVPL